MFYRTIQTISTQLDTSRLWVKGIQVYLKEGGPCIYCQKEKINSEIAKYTYVTFKENLLFQNNKANYNLRYRTPKQPNKLFSNKESNQENISVSHRSNLKKRNHTESSFFQFFFKNRQTLIQHRSIWTKYNCHIKKMKKCWLFLGKRTFWLRHSLIKNHNLVH